MNSIRGNPKQRKYRGGGDNLYEQRESPKTRGNPVKRGKGFLSGMAKGQPKAKTTTKPKATATPTQSSPIKKPARQAPSIKPRATAVPTRYQKPRPTVRRQPARQAYPAIPPEATEAPSAPPAIPTPEARPQNTMGLGMATPPVASQVPRAYEPQVLIPQNDEDAIRRRREALGRQLQVRMPTRYR